MGKEQVQQRQGGVWFQSIHLNYIDLDISYRRFSI